MALHLPRRRFTVDDYHQMAQVGILAEDDRIELIEGEIIEMSPMGRHHASTVYRLSDLLFRLFGDSALVGTQNSIRLSDASELQPDLTLLRRQSEFYASALPGPDDIFLVIEVADTSVTYDRQVKMPLYARSGIAEAWLIDLNRTTVTVYRDPGPTGYTTSQVMRRGDRLAPLAFPERELAVADLVG